MALVDQGFKNKVALTTNPGPEHILSLHPDLVIMKGTTPETIGASIETLRVPVIYLGMENPGQFLQDVRNLGTLLGNGNRAAEIQSFYQDRLDRLEERLGGLHESERPRVLTLQYSARGGKAATQVPAPSWIQTIQVERAGGRPLWLEKNLYTDGWTIVNFEQIAQWNPEKVFLIVQFKLNPHEVLASLKADPSWRLLKAVKTGELIVFPSDIFGWDSPDPRWLLGLLWLAKNTHPERFHDLDMEEEVVQFFQQLYGLERALIETKIMPRIHLDMR
jgi:iron complex transport system substrate-binding protein